MGTSQGELQEKDPSDVQAVLQKKEESVMEIKDGPFGVYESEEGDWNYPYLRFYSREAFANLDKYGLPEHDNAMVLEGHLPKARGGCSALVEMTDGDWHLMSEDDDHYWTKAILSDEDIADLLECYKAFAENINVRFKVIGGGQGAMSVHLSWPKGRKAFPEQYRKGRFYLRSHMRKGSAPLVITSIDGKEGNGSDVSHFHSRIRFLEQAVEYIHKK